MCEPRPKARARLDLRAVCTLCLCNVAHFYTICSIFSYAGFLAVDCGWTDDVDEAGLVAGLLPTALIFGRIPTAAAWGALADRYGRAPALKLSLVSIGLGNLFFGLSTQLYVALAVRAVLLGACNGWTSLMSLLCFEIGGERQADVIGYVISSGQLLNLVGPGLGGFTYATLLGRSFPALMPSLLGVALAAAALIATHLFMPETRPARKASAAGGDAAPAKMMLVAGRAGDEDAAARIALAAADDQLDGAPADQQQRLPAAGLAVDGGVNVGNDGSGDRNDDVGGGEARRSFCRTLCSFPLPLVAVLRSAQGMTIFAVFDLVPLWLISSLRAGGLALTEEQVGLVLSVAGGVSLILSWLLLGRAVRALGSRRSLLVGSICSAVFLVAMPLVRSPLLSNTAAAAVTACLLASHSFCALTGASGILAASNNACASLPDAGAVQGVFATVESVGKMLGPALAAPLLAFAIAARPLETSSLVSSGAFFTFLGLAALLVVLALSSLALPPSVDTAPSTFETAVGDAAVDAAAVEVAVKDDGHRPNMRLTDAPSPGKSAASLAGVKLSVKNGIVVKRRRLSLRLGQPGTLLTQTERLPAANSET